MFVYVLEENGDDYHGSSIVGAYATAELAEAKKATLEGKYPCRPKHPECDFRYWYSVARLTVEQPEPEPDYEGMLEEKDDE